MFMRSGPRNYGSAFLPAAYQAPAIGNGGKLTHAAHGASGNDLSKEPYHFVKLYNIGAKETDNFGRTPVVQRSERRDHNPQRFNLWLARGEVKRGLAYGEADDYGYDGILAKMLDRLALVLNRNWQPVSEELTIDHVVPRSHRDESRWKNCVLACLTCNKHKADWTPDEAKTRRRRKPLQPAWNPFYACMLPTTCQSEAGQSSSAKPIGTSSCPRKSQIAPDPRTCLARWHGER